MHPVNVHMPAPADRAALLRLAAEKLRELPGLLLTGPAGIGKSYLLDQLAAQARAEGVRVRRHLLAVLSALVPVRGDQRQHA